MKTRRQFMSDLVALAATTQLGPPINQSFQIPLRMTKNARYYGAECFAPFVGRPLPVVVRGEAGRLSTVGMALVNHLTDGHVHGSMQVNDAGVELLRAGAVACSMGEGVLEERTDGASTVREFKLTGFILSKEPAYR